MTLSDHEKAVAASSLDGALLIGELAIRRALFAKLETELPAMIAEAGDDDHALGMLVAARIDEMEEATDAEMAVLIGRLREVFGDYGLRH